MPVSAQTDEILRWNNDLPPRRRLPAAGCAILFCFAAACAVAVLEKLKGMS